MIAARRDTTVVAAGAPPRSAERTATAAVVAAGFVVFVVAGAAGVARATGRGAPLVIGALLALALGGAAFRRARQLLPREIDGAARRRPVVAGLFALSVLVAFAQTGRLGAFMADPANRWGSAFPSPAATDHDSLSAYVHAADLARRGDANVYEASHYPLFTEVPRAESAPAPRADSPIEHLGRWIDAPYEYPPPFLLLPRLGLTLTHDFLVLRPVWFAVHGVVALLLLLAIPRFIGGSAGLRVGLFTPLLLASMPFMLILQWGQAHLLVVGASVAAMAAFARGRTASGALLLGAAIVTKIFPGLLVVYLALRGRRREALATACACAALVLLSILVLGAAPFRAFFGYQLPRMATGEAFSFFQRGWLYIARNLSISGIVFKLRALGLASGTGAAGSVAWLYTIVLVGLTAWASRLRVDRLGEASVWLGLLVLGSLRSPLAPTVYVVAPVLWLLALRPTRGALGVAGMVASWLVTIGPPPLPNATLELTTSLIVQAAVVFFAVRAVVRPPRSDARDASSDGATAPALLHPEHALS